MSKISQLYDRILSYLRDVLSNKERHQLERNMTNDPFSEEAFEGLTMLQGKELESDMELMFNRLDDRLQKKKRYIITPLWRIAAAIVLLSGVAAVLFILLRTPEQQIISQDTGKQSAAPETAIPPVPGATKSRAVEENTGKMEMPDEEMANEEMPVRKRSASVTEYDQVDEIISNKTIEETENVPRQMQAEEVVTTDMNVYAADSLSIESGYITGRILGVNRKALPGVSLAEEGTGQVTRTDMQGTFRMKVSNPSSKIELSHAGYKNMEVASRDLAGKEISLDEEKRSQEIVVLGFHDGTVNRSATSAAAKEKAPKSTVDPYKRPLPPGGSMKEFEAWVESRVDTMQLKQLLPGNYRIQVKLTVFKDGKIGNISIPDDIPDIASSEYKNAVSLSERWQPAMVGNLPVDSEIMIEFSLTIK